MIVILPIKSSTLHVLKTMIQTYFQTVCLMSLYKIKNFDETVFNTLGKAPSLVWKLFLWVVGPFTTAALVGYVTYLSTLDHLYLVGLLVGQVLLSVKPNTIFFKHQLCY